MLFVMRETELLPVNASQTTSETPTLPADQSALSTLTVLQASNAGTSTVLIPAQVSVAQMLTAGWPIISQCVSVTRAILVIHSCPAEDHQNLVIGIVNETFFFQIETF